MADSSNWRTGASANPGAQPRRNDFSSHQASDFKRPQRQHEDSSEVPSTIIEGRRIYLGNLLYSTTIEDINVFLADNGFAMVENVHISIDRFTGRNPGYCFVEFADKATADDAMKKLEGAPLSDRPVKCRPCQPKGNQRQAGQWTRAEGREDRSAHGSDRWDDWSRPSGDSGHQLGLAPSNSNSGRVSTAQEEGRQLYIAGLPRMSNQTDNVVDMKEIFKDFAVYVSVVLWME